MKDLNCYQQYFGYCSNSPRTCFTRIRRTLFKNAAKIDLLDICPCPVADPRDRAKNHDPCPRKNRWVPKTAAQISCSSPTPFILTLDPLLLPVDYMDHCILMIQLEKVSMFTHFYIVDFSMPNIYHLFETAILMQQ